MGLVKDAWIAAQERGWSAPDTYVCADCIADEFLKTIINEHLVETECSYCDRLSDEPIAAPMEEVFPYIAGAFYQHYQEPGAAGLPRDSGEWVGEDLITDTADAFLSLDVPFDGQLFEDICDSFDNPGWIPAADGWWLGEHEHERLKIAWNGFVYRTKHTSRYFFMNGEDDADALGQDYEPAQILEFIGKYIQHLNLWQELTQEQVIYRARRIPQGTKLETFDNVCPPPPEMAAAGRMNPPGISYGYFAFDENTAVLEVSDAPPCSLAVAKFSLRKPMLAIDLTRLPSTPSIFDIDRKDERDSLIFLHSFVAAISKPVTKDGREHVEYVPSQIVCEYMAQVLKLRENESAGALLYPSAVDPGHVNIVIFPGRSYRTGWADVISLVEILNVTIANAQQYGGVADRTLDLYFGLN